LTSEPDVIRELNEAVSSGDTRAFSKRMHPEVVWEHNIGAGSPEEGVYSGRESVTELFERIMEPWEYMRAIPQEIREVGPSTYEVRGELYAKHQTSAQEVVTPYEQRLEISNGVLVKGRMVTGRAS
jgi:ketosteroid isomerase-like protein